MRGDCCDPVEMGNDETHDNLVNLVSKACELLEIVDLYAIDGRDQRVRPLPFTAGFALHLPAKDNWFTWSLLFSLILDGKVETAHTGKSRPKYRLTT